MWHTPVRMGGSAHAAAVGVTEQGDPNFPQTINEV